MQRHMRWCLMPAVVMAAVSLGSARPAAAGGGISITIGGYPSDGYGYRSSYRGPYGPSFRPGPHYYGVGWYSGPSPYRHGYGRYGGQGSYHHHHHGHYGW